MEMRIELGAGGRVAANYRGLSVTTMQDGSAPAPFELFLASIGTCAGIYVARFCEERGIPLAGIELRQHVAWNPGTRRVERIDLDIRLPEGFPERYREAVVRAARLCAVKKALEAPPEIVVRTTGMATPQA